MKQKRRKLSMKVKDGAKVGARPEMEAPRPVLRLLVRVPERGLQDQAGDAARGQSRHVGGLDAKPTMA
jgi:hypothetical protein